MKADVNYKIIFYSDWHCSSGQSAGFGIDLTVIRDRHGLPFIPGRTLKGLLRDAAENLRESGVAGNSDSWKNFIDDIFGKGGDKEGGSATECYFSNAELPEDIKSYLVANDEEKSFLFRHISSTAECKINNFPISRNWHGLIIPFWKELVENDRHIFHKQF